MTLLQEFKQLKTLKEKRLFALKQAKEQNNTYHIEMLSYEKLSSFSVHCLFYNSIGKKYKAKRTYRAKHNKERNF